MDKIELTPEQQQKVLDFWNKDPNSPPDIVEITEHIWGLKLDGRTKEGRAIISFLSSRSLAVETKTNYKPVRIELSQAHKLFIDNNYKLMTAVEMARVIFANERLTNLHGETRAVNEYVKTLSPEGIAVASPDDVPAGNYQAPDTTAGVLKKVNSYLNNAINKDSLSHADRKGLDALKNYLHNDHFDRQINSYDSERDRKSFEDAFVRYTYNKPELSQEEVDQYIVLAHEVVVSFKAQRRSEKLQQMLEAVTDASPDNAKISMALVDAISKAQNEYHQCVARQQKLLDDLTEKRSDKLSKQIKDNATILNIIMAWKQEETRIAGLKYVQMEQDAVNAEVDKLSALPDFKAKIMGLIKDETKYGY
jgi:hypothetical protein